MSTEKRLTRVEDKLDDLKEDVVEMKTDMKYLLPKVEEHITGDKKIIYELAPVLEKLPTIVQIAEDYNYEKRKKAEKAKYKKERNEKWKAIATKVGLVSAVVGIITGVVRTFF